MTPFAYLVCLVVCGQASDAGAKTGEVDSGADLVRGVRKTHPRLMLLDDNLPRLRKAVKEDPTLAGWYRKVRASAEALLNGEPIAYRYGQRSHMLASARQAVDRIYQLGLVYRLEGDGRFARRGVEELLAACKLDTWNPAHFLDTAELTHAVAVGYDWFYCDLTSDQRAAIREAICRLGLKESLPFYATSLPVTLHHLVFNWAGCNHNWNLVCNGGMTIGALAIADEEPQLAGRVLTGALRSIRFAMTEFGPDGGWAEGPSYWRYATEYAVYLLVALETAIGRHVIEPYLHLPGFAKCGEFCIHVLGPTDRTFNFADAHDRATRAPQMFWLARTFNRPVYAWYGNRFPQGGVQDILWYDARQKGPAETGLPQDAYFRHVEVVFLRSNWEDPDAVYVGFKGGDNSVNHSHLDLGSFVLDADGCRWAVDLGSDDYALPRYFLSGKNEYYRLKTEGHNTLLIDGLNQQVTAKAPIVAFLSRPGRAFAVADLSQAYGKPSGRIRRGVARLAGRQVLVQDEIELTDPAEVIWQMHTQAKIALDGRIADLRRGGKSLRATLLEPKGAGFEVANANPPRPQGQQPDVKKLVIRLKLTAGESRVAVLFSPGRRFQTPELKPLSTWIEEAKRSAAR